MHKVYGICSCGETFDGTALAEEQLRAIETQAPEMSKAMRANEGTPFGVCAQAWWQEHVARVPVRVRSQHELTMRMEAS